MSSPAIRSQTVHAYLLAGLEGVQQLLGHLELLVRQSEGVLVALAERVAPPPPVDTKSCRSKREECKAEVATALSLRTHQSTSIQGATDEMACLNVAWSPVHHPASPYPPSLSITGSSRRRARSGGRIPRPRASGDFDLSRSRLRATSAAMPKSVAKGSGAARFFSSATRP